MRKIISTSRAPAAIGPYNQAVRFGDFVFVSGQLGLDPETGALDGDTVGAQAKRVMTNLANVLEAAGGGLGDLVKTTIFLTNLDHFVEVNGIYAACFEELGVEPPARATVEVSRLPAGAVVEIEGIAAIVEGG